jgi:hypothetical protein
MRLVSDMAEKPKTWPARIAGMFGLIADFIVLLLVGILWVPLQVTQQRHMESEPVETEERASETKRDYAKRPSLH